MSSAPPAPATRVVPRSGGMTPATSFFLNAIRVIAAAVVFANHIIQIYYPQHFGGFKDIGHKAVVVFFVLSGYVIAYSVYRRPTTLRDYVVSRLSRLYSVVIPAVVLTALLLVVGREIAPAAYAAVERGGSILRLVLSGAFLQEAWFLSASPPTNSPLWSLGYEFAYYAIFAGWIFSKPGIWRWLIVGGVAAVFGPKILLLFPIWLMGVAIYRWSPKLKLSLGSARTGFVLSVLGFCAASSLVPDWPFRHGLPTLYYSGAYGSDFLVGVATTAMIVFFSHGFGALSVPARLKGAVDWLADHTFSLYLYHFPLLFFIRAVVPVDAESVWQMTLLVGGLSGVIACLSLLTEAKRRWWYDLFSAVWGGAARVRGGAPASPSKVSTL